MKKVPVVFLTLFSIFCVFISARSDCIRGSGGGGTPFSATDDFNRSNADALGALSGGTYTWTEVSGDSDIETIVPSSRRVLSSFFTFERSGLISSQFSPRYLDRSSMLAPW